MIDLHYILVATLVGAGLGLAYFGGLWWTVCRLPTSSAPARLLLVSLVLRLTCLLSGLYLIMGNRWENLVACLAGFLVLRAVLLHRWGTPECRLEIAAGVGGGKPGAPSHLETPS